MRMRVVKEQELTALKAGILLLRKLQDAGQVRSGGAISEAESGGEGSQEWKELGRSAC